jgi:hypothetical protein
MNTRPRGKKMDEKRREKLIFWAPRIMSIIFVLFLALFSLDVFDMNLGFWETVLGLFMHNIPALFLLIVLLIAWKYEIVGAIFYTLAGLAYIVITATSVGFPLALTWSLTIAGPAILIGWLFYLNWRRKKNKKGKEAGKGKVTAKKTTTKTKKKGKKKSLKK